MDVVLAPGLLAGVNLEGALCAVIDVLRATSTMVTALGNGAAAIVPCLNAEEARQQASLTKIPHLLGGEEMGKRIPGFHLGNSPLEYWDGNLISGKTIFMATTNGTPMLRKAQQSGLPVYLGALLNITAVCSAMTQALLKGVSSRLFILCSGRQGQTAAEDLFCAGLMVNRLCQQLTEKGIAVEVGDAASVAGGFARCSLSDALQIISASEHGRYLKQIGFGADVEFASHLDIYSVVPLLENGIIRT